MDILIFVFALFSFVLFMNGMLLKSDHFKSIIVKSIKKDDAKERVELISNFIVTTSIIALVWTVIGYALYDLLLIEFFVLIYLALIGIAGLSLFFVFRSRFR